MRVSGRVGGTTGSRGGGRGARLGREGDFRWRVYLWRSGTCRLSELKGALWGSLVCAAEQKPRGRGASGASKALSSGDSESGLGGAATCIRRGLGSLGICPQETHWAQAATAATAPATGPPYNRTWDTCRWGCRSL